MSCFNLIFAGLGISLSIGSAVWAQGNQPPATATPATSAQQSVALAMEIHLRIVQELYELNPEQSAKLRTELTPLIGDQQAYEERLATTLRRMSLARSILQEETAAAPAELARKIAPFDEQYRQLKAAAPLSIANIVKKAEALLPPDQIASRRARIATMERFKNQGVMTPEKIDAVLTGPLPASEPPSRSKAPDTLASQQPTTLTPAPKVEKPPTAAAPSKPAAPAPQPVLPPAPPRPPAEPAPPVADWSKMVEQTGTELNFTDAQKTSAQSILAQSQKRAEAYRLEHAADYDAAEKNSDAAKKTEALKTLNGPLNQIYSELKQRLESVASLEQMQKAGRAPKVPPMEAAHQHQHATPPASPVSLPTTKPASTPPTKPLQPTPPPAAPPSPTPAAKPAPKTEKTESPQAIPTAPPLVEWNKVLDSATQKYDFTPQQQAQAKDIFESCQKRALKYREQNLAAYETAEKLTDSAKKTEQLRTLNQKLDILYGELVQRVESLATLEQNQKAARKPNAAPQTGTATSK